VGVFSSVFFSPLSVVLLDFFNRVFGRFVTGGGGSKTRQKSRGKLSAAAKKSSYLLTFFFNSAPCAKYEQVYEVYGQKEHPALA
jgi:hypothetical protein